MQKGRSKLDIQSLIDALFCQHPWHGVSVGDDAPNIVNVYVEMVPGDNVKYELDKRSGHLKIDRVHHFSSVCPNIYGFVPRTYCGTQIGKFCAQQIKRKGMKGDGDPVDISVLTDTRVLQRAILLRARIIGGFRMIDGNEADDKLIAVLENDVAFNHFQDIDDCPQDMIDRLMHYFLTYKQLPGKEKRRVKITDTYNRKVAHQVVRLSQADYLTDYGTTEQRLAALREMLVK